MQKTPTILIVAPFWNNKKHVGVYRVERFVRWLSEHRYRIVLVSAGSDHSVIEHPWGVEVCVKDRMPTVYADAKDTPKHSRLFYKLVRYILYAVCIPDQFILWAFSVAKHPAVLRYMEEVDAVLSSNPPESVHIAARKLSSRFAVPLIVDMRDGWLDEPLKPIIEQLWLRRYSEGILERSVMERAGHIFVTSTQWKNKLVERYPFTGNKVTVLTNGYALHHENLLQQRPAPTSGTITIVHAGQFSVSHMKRKVQYLLEPLLQTAKRSGSQWTCKIIFVGFLGSKDQSEVEEWKKKFNACHWELVTMPYMPRNEMFTLLQQSNGLMLLEVKSSGIPSKMFEYIPTGKPVLSLTPKHSAVWELCKNIPQVFLADCFLQGDEDHEAIDRFFNACKTGKYRINVPDDFSEKHLSSIFIDALSAILPRKSIS